MTRWTRILVLLAATLMIGVTLGACSDDDDTIPNREGEGGRFGGGGGGGGDVAQQTPPENDQSEPGTQVSPSTGSNDGPGTPGTPGTPGSQGPDPTPGPAPAPGCPPSFVISSTIGNVCTAEADCEAGSRCVNEGGGTARCQQLCAPELCTSTCADNQYCFGLVTGEQEDAPPVIIDDVPAGVCQVGPAPMPGSYARCDAQTPCAGGTTCGTFDENDTFGTCVPTCDTPESECPGLGNQPAFCALTFTDSNDRGCVIPCEASCPDGLTCRVLGEGRACLR